MRTGGLLLAAAILIVFATLLARSNSSQSIGVPILPGPGEAERQAALEEFAATHDWDAEFAAVGLELPRSVRDQIIEPLRDPGANELEAASQYSFEVEFRGFEAFAPPFRETSAAIDLVRARLVLEANLIDAAALPDPGLRRNRIWAAYGRGFGSRMREWLTARRSEETDPDVRALIDDLLERWGARREP